MGAVSYSQVIVTLFTYVQRLGIAANFPGVKIPKQLQKLLVVMVNFYNTIEASVPDVPDFDFRSQLVLLSVGIPLLLDIIFIWFIFPFYDVIMHIIDVIGLACFTYFLTTGIVVGFDSVTTTWTVVSAIYIISRIVLMFYNKSKTNEQLFDLVRSICSFFMSHVMPQSEKSITFKELNIQIRKFSKLIDIVPEKGVYWKAAIWLFFGLAFIIGGYVCLGLFFDPGKLPEIVRIVLPIFLLPLGFVCWIAFMLKMFPCGRKVIVKIKQFIRRWGLRFLMLALDVLYIPIIQCLVYHMTPKPQGCDPDYYFYYKHQGTDFLDPFINKTVECLPCARHVTGVCVDMCKGTYQLRMKSSPALLFVDDVLGIMAGVVIYTLVIIMFGIPIMWYLLVRRNTGFVRNINVYGATSEDKWEAITNRLHTTGIFIFQDFKFTHCYWCVFLIVMKLVAMLIEVISEILWLPFIVAQPFYYLFSFVVTWYFAPYLHKFNNILETLLEGVNLVFSIIVVISYFRYEIPEVMSLPFTILLLGLPIVSCFFIVCFDDVKGTKEDEDDPTIIRKVVTQNISRKNSSLAINHRDDMEQLLLPDDQEQPPAPTDQKETDEIHLEVNEEKEQKSEEEKKNDDGENNNEDDGPWEVADCDDQHCILEDGMLDTMDEAIEREKDSLVSPEERVPMVAFEVRKTKCAKLMTKMYETLDVVLDGSTIELLTKILETTVLFGAAATGWYLGALFAHHEKDVDIICG